MTQSRVTDDLLRWMLERRASGPPPEWLLPSVAQAVRAAPESGGGRGRASWRPSRRSERLVLIAAAAVLLLVLAAGAMVAAGVILRAPKSPLSGTAVGPSPSLAGSSEGPSASPSGTMPAPGPRSSTSPAQVVASAWALPAGWRYELNCDDDGSQCGLSLVDEAGRVQEGWPVIIAGRCDGSPLAIGPRDSVFVACTRDGHTTVTGLDRNGNALPGWPVSLRGRVAESTWNDFASAFGWPSIAVGPDATVYVAIDTSGAGSYALHALGPDGASRSGWPVDVAGNARGFRVAPDGDIVAWWYEDAQNEIQLNARRTVFTEIGQDGRVLSGWPRGSTGAASGPVVLADGSLFYVSATGKVWGHDRAGEIMDGWPYELANPVAPTLRADGTLMFIEHSGVVVIDRHGGNVSSWPYRTSGTFMGPGCDTGGFSFPLAAVAEDGTLHLASWDGDRSSVVALGSDGNVVDGWPYDVPTGWRVADLSFDRDGMLTAALFGDDCGGLDATSIRLDSRGKLVGDAPPTPLNQVYKAMRLGGLRTSSGNATFVQGAQIDFDVALANRSSTAITLPRVNDEGRSWYAAGALQSWLEPLVQGPPLWYCLPYPSQGNERYATGGQVIVTADPVTIAPGQTLPSLLHASLPQETTACLPPGEYRFRFEYKRYGVKADDVMDEDDPIDQATLDFTITPRAPSVTPAPTPIPSPWPTPPPTPPSAAPSPSAAGAVVTRRAF